MTIVSPMGLSPHIRGNLDFNTRAQLCQGSIPAHTGEPLTPAPSIASGGVYPRTYGGTNTVRPDRSRRLGLSPHIRGNRRIACNPSNEEGSIPAHTGEPLTPAPSIASGGVYPAHTGEPIPSAPTAAAAWVYPRTYGGTGGLLAIRAMKRGLSPHIRGNPPQVRSQATTTGSIPAHTGEPAPGAEPRAGARVYPRTYGGTAFLTSRERTLRGLSPHIRGNLYVRGRHNCRSGSIPAHTGEPAAGRIRHCRCGVYPRTYGGTASDFGDYYYQSGLSPHIRGNRGVALSI